MKILIFKANKNLMVQSKSRICSKTATYENCKAAESCFKCLLNEYHKSDVLLTQISWYGESVKYKSWT